jgi:hypothetical protein
MVRFKHPMDIENIPIGTFYSIFYILFVTPFLKNPCKKCLVQACCTEICDSKKEFNNMVGAGKLWEAKLLSCSLWFVVFSIVLGILWK